MQRCAILFLISMSGLIAAEWHVAASADDGDGSPGSPFASIQTAADQARAGDTVVIASGIYRETVRPPRDGTSAAPIIFTAAPGATVTVSGMDVVAGDWRRDGDTWSIDLGAVPDLTTTFTSIGNQAEQLLYDGRMLPAARHPSLDLATLNPLDGAWLTVDTIETLDTSTPDWAKRYRITDAELATSGLDLDGGSIWMKPWQLNGHGWGFLQSGRIISHAGDALEIEISTNDKYAPGAIYYIGHAAALDAPGEWWHDADHRLHLRTPDGSDPRSHQVEIKRRDLAFDLDRRSYIHIHGLRIVGASITTDRDAGNKGRGDGATPVGRSSLHGWPIAPATGIEISDCHFRYISHFEDCSGGDNWQWSQESGVIISGTDHVIRDCLVEYSAGNGIVAIGHDILVANNIVHDVDYMLQLSAGISTGHEFYNYGITIRNNTVYRCGFDAITTQHLRSRDGQASRVHHNRVAAFGLWTEDVGGIKSVGHDTEINGTRWDHNAVSDAGDWSIGLYQDFSGGFLMDHNLVWNVNQGVNINHAYGHQLHHNTVWADGDSSIGGIELIKDVDARNNLGNEDITGTYDADSILRSNLTGQGADAVLDAAKGDFRLSGDSPAIDAGEHIPGINDDVSDGAPDIGALEYGAPLPQYGSSLPLPIAAPTDLAAILQVDGSVQLHWTDNADNEAHYYIERALVDERGRHWHIIAELPADSSTYRDAEMLSAGVAWRVRADESLFSNTAVLQVGLAGWWPLDADPADHAASDIIPDDGVAANGAALVADAERGTALALDRGEQQRLRIPDSPEVHIRDRFTLLFWIRPASDNKLGKIINKRSNLGNDGIGFTLDYQFNRLRLVTNLSHGDSIEWTPPADAWTHIAIVYDGPNQHMRLVSRTAAGVATTRLDKDDWRHLDLSVSEDWYIGGYPGDASDRHFSGGIDDVRLYQEVLTPTEIAAILAGAEAQAPRVEMEGLETSSREGGQTPALVHVVREHPDPVPLTVRYRLVAGSATQADLPSLAGLLVIPAGQRGSTLQIWPIDDLEPEETEDYRIELEADPTYSLGPQAGVDLRIEDDDDPAARRRLRLVLPADGYSVIGDPSGQEGRWRVGMGLFELEGLPNWQTHRLIISGGDG